MEATDTPTPVTQERLDEVVLQDGLRGQRLPSGEVLLPFAGQDGRPPFRVVVSAAEGAYMSLFGSFDTSYATDAALPAQQHLLAWQARHRWVFGQVEATEAGVVVGAEVHVPVHTGATTAQLQHWLRHGISALLALLESVHDHVQQLPKVVAQDLPSAQELSEWFDA